MQTTQTTPTYLTARDVQELIRVDRSTIYRMAESGRLPAIKIGRQWRFPSDAIHEWLGSTPNDDAGALPPSSTQDVADLFAELYGVMVIVTDIVGNPLTSVSNPCGYFSAVSGEASALERCITEWKALGNQYDFEPRLRPSHLGFLCTRAFIRVGNELAGMVISGGIAPEDWPPSTPAIEAIAIESRVPTATVERSIDDVHRLSPTDQERLLTGIPILAKHLSRIATTEKRPIHPTRSTT
ncbi:MAG: helix-turn-helix domain-containing protein [Actinomycetota bacterium]|nr:helix-turn-helix domain-containing protein [Actinomycetota bacterium]